MRLGQHVDLTVVGQYVDVYIYMGAFSSQDPRNVWLCLMFVWWITLIYLYDHVCIHLIEVCIIVFKKKNESDKYMPKYIHFITCFMPDRPLHYEGLSHILKL